MTPAQIDAAIESIREDAKYDIEDFATLYDAMVTLRTHRDELVEALKWCQCPHCEVIFGQHSDYYEERVCYTCAPWRALIAKAEGR